MFLSICFIILDILAVTKVIKGAGSPDGINPYWKFAFVFKCLTDTIILDDFKTALDRLRNYRLGKLGNCITSSIGAGGCLSDPQSNMKDSVISPTQKLFDVQDNACTETGNCDHIDLEAALQSEIRGKSCGSSAG